MEKRTSCQILRGAASDYRTLISFGLFLVKDTPFIFLWIPKGFISPESLLNFFLNLYIPPWLHKYTWVKKSNLFILLMPPTKTLPQVFIITPWQKEITHSSWTALSKDIFFPSRKGGEDYGVEKINKIKPTRVLVTSLDKIHHLCNLYIIGFCFAVP